MPRGAWLLLPLAALALLGCPTHEFYLQRSEVPWEARGITKVAVPVFDAPPTAWAAADEAHARVVEALGHGTVQVVDEKDHPEAVVKGAIAHYIQSSTPGAPRRVLQDANQQIGQVYVWELDVSHVIQVTLAIRVLTAEGGLVWSKEGSGQGSESNTVELNWPGDDPVPPPAAIPFPPDPALYERLRRNAMDQALQPLVEALATRYSYRTF